MDAGWSEEEVHLTERACCLYIWMILALLLDGFISHA